MKFGVVQFPGSYCDDDTCYAIASVIQQPAELIWHQSEEVSGFDAIIVPGGFAFGDYLRTGAIARFSPVMQSVKKFAASGGLVLGICNGFQILCESGMLPGALLRNAGLRYICKQVHVRTETANSPFTQALTTGQVLKIPIGHMEGNYFCEPATLTELERGDRVAFRYCTQAGEVTSGANPNGSISCIAGVLSEGKNVLGMMPHPDRSSEAILGSSAGLLLFRSLAGAMTR